jgi:hypothetical protein
MLTYLLEKLNKIKKDRALYCSQIEKTQIEKTQIEKTQIEKTQIEEEEKEKEKKETRVPTVYDFICKNTRKN